MDDFDAIDSRRDEREAQGMQPSPLYRDPPDYSQSYQPDFDDIQPNTLPQSPQGQGGLNSPDDQAFQNSIPPYQQAMGDELNDIDGVRDAQNNPDMQGGAPAQSDPAAAGKGAKQKGLGRGARGAGKKRPTERRLQRALQTGDFSDLDLRGDFSRYRSLAHLRNPDGTLTARDLVSPEAQKRHQMHMRGLDQPIQNPNTPQGLRQQQMRDHQIGKIDRMIQQRGINLSNTHLGGTNLSNTNLGSSQTHVNLTGANLSQTNLRGANLSGQSLDRANLNKAQMQGANLSNVRMDQTDLKGANLRGANLNGVNMKTATNAPPVFKGKDRSSFSRR